MKRGFIWIALTCLMVISTVLASCSSSTSTTTATSTPTSTTTSAPVSTTSTTVVAPTSSTSVSTPATTAATSTTTGNWWDSLGMPTYGGTMTISLNTDISGFDDASPIAGLVSVNNAWQDALVADDWTLNPSVFSYQLDFRPSTYEVGDMASDWEFSTPNTMMINIRQGINWQNIAPVNGREFVASDVIYHYDRIVGRNDKLRQKQQTLAHLLALYFAS